MVYHVRIGFNILSPGIRSEKTETVYDLSHEQVINNFVTPFRNNGPVVVNGYVVNAASGQNNSRSLTIWATDESASAFAELHMEEFRARLRRVTPPIDPLAPDSKMDRRVAVTYLAQDVTNELFSNMSTPATTPLPTETFDTTKVFIVHGHDELALAQVARFLEKLKLSPIILNEQANAGKTLIEKLEAHTDVGFAVVLLTPDDCGGVKTAKPEDFSAAPRARQNVIFELGYLMAKLKRERVSAILAPGIEKPSDIDGLAYLPMDPQKRWHFELAKEMKAAGLDIDMNLAV